MFIILHQHTGKKKIIHKLDFWNVSRFLIWNIEPCRRWISLSLSLSLSITLNASKSSTRKLIRLRNFYAIHYLFQGRNRFNDKEECVYVLCSLLSFFNVFVQFYLMEYCTLATINMNVPMTVTEERQTLWLRAKLSYNHFNQTDSMGTHQISLIFSEHFKIGRRAIPSSLSHHTDRVDFLIK